MKVQFDKHAQKYSFQIGDKVLGFDTNKNPKLMPNWKGPAEIKKSTIQNMLWVLIKFIKYCSLPFFGEFPYEMLMEIGMDMFDLVALLKGTELAMGLGLRSGIGIEGADGVSVGVSCLLEHFFKMIMPMMKMASMIPIILAGEVNVQ
jgi:hypothetical protein